MIKKIISGGQTGVDQAALTISMKLNIPHGGWCPKGRLSESGTIPMQYKLTETLSSDYSVRTKLNIQDSDGTLILLQSNIEKIFDGTILTAQYAQETKKQYLLINLAETLEITEFTQWVIENKIKILNIAGPRESQSPGISELSMVFLEKALKGVPSRNNQNVG